MECKVCGHAAEEGDRCPSCGARLAFALLEVMRGDTPSETYYVGLRELRIGRAWENDLSLPESSVSRLHARVYHEGGRVFIEDLGSTQGVYINGKKHEQAELSPGDVIHLGSVKLAYSLPSVAALERTKPAGPEDEFQRVLLSVVEAINSTLILDEVIEAILEAVMRITGAERGFLLLVEPESKADDDDATPGEAAAGMRLRAARTRKHGRAGVKFEGISTSILKQVREQGEMVATRNAAEDPALKPFESVASMELRTVVCIPLKSPGRADETDTSRAIGAIYVDNHALAEPFKPEALRAAEALAKHATLAIQNAQLFAQEERTVAELRVARDKAFEASRAKSAFLANMSHELHTPLNAIIGYTEMLSERAAEAGQPEFLPDLKKIRQSGKHLLRLIDDVLDISRLESGDLALSHETFDLAEEIVRVAEGARPLATKNGNTIEVRTDPNLGTVHADPKRLRQVLTSLLSNAAKFTEQGTIVVDAQRETTEASDSFRVDVSDTGIGMTPEQAAGVFEAFSQADGSTTRRHGGMGIGLAISKQLCEKMNGELSLRSELGKGSCFTIRIPARTLDTTGTRP